MGFFSSGLTSAFLKQPGATPDFSDMLMMLVIDGMMPSPHSFRSHVGIESSSHDLLGALLTSFRMSSWDASRKEVREQAAGNSSGPHGNAPKSMSVKVA